MANSVDPVLFIEFYGFPGCGKSTVSHFLAEKIRLRCHYVNEPSFFLDHHVPHVLRAIKKLYICCTELILHYGLFRQVLTIVKRNGYKGLDVVMQVSNVLQKLKIYNNSDKTKIVIWDQGLIQAAISLSVNGKIDASTNFRELLAFISYQPKIIGVLLKVDCLTALERMNQRSSNDSRIEQSRGLEQQRLMNAFEDGINSIYCCSDLLYSLFIVDGLKNIDKQVDCVYSFLEKISDEF